MPANPTVLFVCTHNSARSQMAHGYLEYLVGKRMNVLSAGVEPGQVHPLAVEAMLEVGIDISNHTSNGLREYLGHERISYLITVCDQAAQACPSVWPGLIDRFHWSFDDPSSVEGNHDERLAAFRVVRNEIKAQLDDWLTQH